ncbi:hypothetical protein H5410_032588 [Solanum commersonii]|uniref:Uncharacterized protein n=1 Tax=Solanum commersonii TaxID=4109 RepID=A0A9J5YLD1_SOLCO|nr:hypothetical protein H5410_032588 [Solanum commersonii]
MCTFFIYLLDWLVQKQVVKLKSFSKFENTSEALSVAMLLINSKPNKGLRKFLKAHCDGETLAVADSKLGNAINEKLVYTGNNILQLLSCFGDGARYRNKVMFHTSYYWDVHNRVVTTEPSLATTQLI